MIDFHFKNIVQQDGITVINSEVILADGTVLPPCPSIGDHIVIVKRRVYIDGYEYKNGKWQRTLRSIFYDIFG